MLDALIFDFDGVIVDSEPIHLACFRQVLAERGIGLTDEDYYAKYIGFDDHDCFAHVLADNGRAVDEAQIKAMTAQKTLLVQQAIARSIRPLPGAIELMRAARASGAGVAICSGALRAEIELAGRTVGALQYVDVLVAAQDVKHGKPDPEGYRLAVKLLGEKRGRPVGPAHTWVIEDAPAGVLAAKAAGCRVLAVTNSYHREHLTGADLIVESLMEITLERLVSVPRVRPGR